MYKQTLLTDLKKRINNNKYMLLLHVRISCYYMYHCQGPHKGDAIGPGVQRLVKIN